MPTDLEIARTVTLLPISDIAQRAGVPEAAVEFYGRYKAKLTVDALHDGPVGKLILVTAINPTPAGEGKTTTSIGLADALNLTGRKTVLALREPSLGPCFGTKGGATGGGRAQVVPMEDINLHFTGDFHAVTAAHNLLAAIIDNHINWGNTLDIADYFKNNGSVNADLQRETEYTKLLANKIVDCFHRENIVLSSHVVAFTAFNMLKTANETLDLYALLRLPPDDYVFPIEQFTAAVEAVQAALIELEAKNRLKLSNEIRLSPAELVADGMKNVGIYHVRKPLLFNKKGDIESDDFNTLFFYHNRLENFGLAKRVKWENFKMEMKDE